MYRFKDISIRKFELEDIPYKVAWINEANNNQFLHYNLPITIEDTEKWFFANKDREDRWDATVLYNGVPVGLTGLLNIDQRNKTAEDYIVIGDTSKKKIGLGTKAGILNFAHAFYDFGINKLWGTIEAGNVASLKRTYKLGGHVEGFLHQYAMKNEQFIDAFYVGYFREEFRLPDDVYDE